MDKPLHAQQFELPLKAVLIRCLNLDQEPIRNAVASSFILQEQNRYYLYTCWHVVTGYNPHDVRVTNRLPDRKYLQVALQDAQNPQHSVTVIGGLQLLTIPLYDMSVEPHRPLWSQDEQDVPQPDLNAINIRVPFWHDAIKIPLPHNI